MSLYPFDEREQSRPRNPTRRLLLGLGDVRWHFAPPLALRRMVTAEVRCGVGLVELQSLSAAVLILPCRSDRHHVGRLDDPEGAERSADRIGDIAG